MKGAPQGSVDEMEDVAVRGDRHKKKVYWGNPLLGEGEKKAKPYTKLGARAKKMARSKQKKKTISGCTAPIRETRESTDREKKSIRKEKRAWVLDRKNFSACREKRKEGKY